MKNSNIKHINRFFINLFFIFFFSASVFAQTSNTEILFEKYRVEENITYKNNSENQPLNLDIYYPKNNDPQKKAVVVFLHGGAWAKGDKQIPPDNYVENTISKLLENNFIVISANYTLVTENIHFPNPAIDTKDIIRWIRKNADQYNFDANNIGMWGVSAGAHLSLLTAYTEDHLFKGDPELVQYSAKVNYVVSNFGPTDLNKLFHTKAPQPVVGTINLISKKLIILRQKLVQGMTGLDIKKDKKQVVDLLASISPINYTQHTVPTLMLHGDKDKIAPLMHSKRLKKMLNKQHTFNELIVVKGGDHGFKTTDASYLNQLTDKMVDFMKAQKK